MFQRLRDAIDSRIAEEQARQKSAQDSISRSNSARRATDRVASPSSRSRTRRNTHGTPVRGPDPTEFEPELGIGDDEESSRSGTAKLDSTAPLCDQNTESATERKDSESHSDQLPTELPPMIRAKLRRLDKLETRYHELLKAYRLSHARVLSIEPFEAALREHTPLVSIADPKALVEYLNQISLKGDMVTEELKRITAERDDYKRQLDEAKRSAGAAFDEVASLKARSSQGNADTGPKKAEKLTVDTTANDTGSDELAKSPAVSISSVGAIGGFFLAKQKPSVLQDESEEFFSFDSEIPRIESELKKKQEEAATLKLQAESLKRDLSVARESTESMAKSLESATRELAELRDTKDKQSSEIDELKTSKRESVDVLNNKLVSAEATIQNSQSQVKELEAELKQVTDELSELRTKALRVDNSDGQSELCEQLNEAKKEKEIMEKRICVLQSLVDSMRSELRDAEATATYLKATIEQKCNDASELQNIVNMFDSGLKDNPTWHSFRGKLVDGEEADFNELMKSLFPAQKGLDRAEQPIQERQAEAKAQGNLSVTSSNKKKKNKRKKGDKDSGDANKTAAASVQQDGKKVAGSESMLPSLDDLKERIETLMGQLREKDAAIDLLSSKLKGEDDLKEEIECLRDDLLHIGQDNVEAKDKIKELSAGKAELEKIISKLEEELVNLRADYESQDANDEQTHGDLQMELEDLRVRATTLETDLLAAQQLATTRFKDLTDLRETLQKIQPELKSLRSESVELRSAKESLTVQIAHLRAEYDGIYAERKTLRSSITERDSDLKGLNQKIQQEVDSRLKAEEALAVARSDLKYSEAKKREAVESKEKVAVDLGKAQEELKSVWIKLGDAENKINGLTSELNGLREEIQLKTAQHASAQSLMNSMRDQAGEMAMQTKEAKERCESLEEELADMHRLLSERTREGETMRRLLNDIEGRTESKVRDFKERMEAAIAERDRVEDEASVQGRRLARELEELKSKIREIERVLRAVEQDKEELEYSQRDWKRKRSELEALSERSADELRDAKETVTRLRESLDDSEKHVRDLEKERVELRRSVEETNSRLEKLRKSTRFEGRAHILDPNNQSSRSSIDSGSRRDTRSPITQDWPASSRRSETYTGPGSSAIDYVYLKNVLLQFLEQKDRSYQKQLIPVLGMLLHFDRTDEQKWIAAITSK